METPKNNSNKKKELIPIILSGGSGSRLWPLSRSCYPKQYLNLDEKNSYSLLQNTYLRLIGINNLKSPTIVCNEDQRFIVAEQMRELNVKPNSIILEPIGRNTAPAIALAALQALKENKDPFLLILSSDHLIKEEKIFRNTIEEGVAFAEKGKLVTFGILPDNPSTEFGYIKTLDELSIKNNSSDIKEFIEKPNLEVAKRLINDKRYVWNSGMFLFKSSAIINELEKFEPEIIKYCKDSIEKSSKDLDFLRVEENNFKKCPNIPIDIAVMEKTSLGTVLTLDAGWSDIGSWESIWANSSKDENGNSSKGKVILDNSKDCYLRSEERLVVGIGLKNLIVIETKDAVLVSDKKSTNKIKKIVQHLNENNYSESKFNKKMYRPWGNYTSIDLGHNWQVKKLEIKPYASLSLQMHHHRSEHWVIVSGLAKVEIDNQISFLSKNQSIYVPLGAKHRLTNPNKEQLILIEVQSGSYLGEDDIVRFEDNYGRNIQ